MASGGSVEEATVKQVADSKSSSTIENKPSSSNSPTSRVSDCQISNKYALNVC